MLLSSWTEDTVVKLRHFYNRHLTKRLIDALWDAKHPVLFHYSPDSRMLGRAPAGVRELH
ncbi:hypothetical protein [Nocardiopsis oceani]